MPWILMTQPVKSPSNHGDHYPLAMTDSLLLKMAIEMSWVFPCKNMVIFHSYVSLPEDIWSLWESWWTTSGFRTWIGHPSDSSLLFWWEMLILSCHCRSAPKGELVFKGECICRLSEISTARKMQASPVNNRYMTHLTQVATQGESQKLLNITSFVGKPWQIET